MATGTYTFNALRAKTLKELIKKTKKNCKTFKFDKSNAVGVGNTAAKIIYFYTPSGLGFVRKALW